MASLSGRLEGIIGVGIPDVLVNGTLEMALCGYGSQVPRVNGQALIGRLTEKQITVDSSGNFGPIEFYGNDAITPAGTYYTITVKDENGDIQQVNAYEFTGSNPIDLNSTNPIDPDQPPPAIPTPAPAPEILFVDWSNAPNFDGSAYTAFAFTLHGDAAPTISGMVAGNLYTFVINQDGGGFHAFAWPAGCHGAMTVNPSGNSVTAQTFLAFDATNLYAISAGSYTP